MKFIFYIIVSSLSVLGLEYLLNTNKTDINYNSLIITLIIIGIIFLISLFFKGSVKFARSFLFTKALISTDYDFLSIEKKIDTYINIHNYYLLNKKKSSNELYYEIQIPMTFWSWGNKLTIDYTTNCLKINSINTSFIQFIDLKLTNKILVEELVNSLRID
ncbi:MAG: hypothetical protein IPK91_15390 [Saprospiraceae bacterium]|nr:hypothetical protein [Saprospiraceae bacterium]